MESMRREECLEDFYKRITLSVIYFCNETIKNTFNNFKKISKNFKKPLICNLFCAYKVKLKMIFSSKKQFEHDLNPMEA